MSINKRIYTCFGMIIPKEIIDKILKNLAEVSPEEHDNLLDSEYLKPLNSWTDGNYFFGITKYLGDLSEPIKTRNLLMDTSEVLWSHEYQEVIKIFDKYFYPEFKYFVPQEYLIQFID